MSLQLTEEERKLLLDVLTTRLSELRQEIRHSRVRSFTEQLKQTGTIFQSLITKLESCDTTVGSEI